jgi:hypothetical protein
MAKTKKIAAKKIDAEQETQSSAASVQVQIPPVDQEEEVAPQVALSAVHGEGTSMAAAILEPKKIWPFHVRRPGVPRKSPQTLSKKAGLVFPVSRIKRMLQEGKYAKKIQTGEYITSNAIKQKNIRFPLKIIFTSLH